MIDKLALWTAQVGPIGRLKYAPGTFGSLCAIPLLLLVKNRHELLFVLFFITTAVGIWSSGRAAKILNLHDPSSVVIDEVCGMLTCFLFAPINWYSLGIGFICFRFFDILKPPPIRLLERAPGGIGIVLDDIGAGVFANLILQIIFRYAQL